MALKFRRGTTAQQSGSLAFGEPYVNTTLGTLLIGGPDGDIILGSSGTGSTGNFGAISGSGLDITGNANIAGNLTLGGTITIGDANTDNLVVNADLSSSIIPDITNVFDLGSTTKVYRNVYATSISGAIAATNGVVSGSSQVTLQSTTGFTAYNTSLATITGSLISSASSDASKFVTLATITGSLISSASSDASKFVTLATYTGSVEGRFTTLATLTGSNSTRLTALEASASTALSTNNSQGVSVTNLNTFSGSALTRLTALEVETLNLESFTSSINTTIKNRLDANTVVSGSSQITYANISSIPAGIVSGSSQLSGTTITNLTITNLTTVNQTASVLFSSGSNKFGDFSNDKHEFTGSVQISGSINTIGASTATSFNGAINATNGVVSGSSQITYASISSIPAGIVSGSSQLTSILPAGVVSGSSQVIGILSSLNTYTGSNDTTNTTQNTRLTALEASASTALSTNGTQATSITNLNSATASLLIETANLETFSSSALTRLTALEVETSNLETFTSSINTTIKTRLNVETVISGSSQVVGSSITTNTVTVGSTAIALGGTATTIAGLTSVSSTGFTGALTGNASTATTLATARTINGTSFNGSANITIPNLVSGSAQITAGSTTNFATDVKTQLNSNTVVSGSSQINVASTTGYSTISSHLSSTSNPHSVTAAQVGLGNVTNESKATMFASPTFTGTVSGVTATHVGLGNVTNESKATMFSSPTFTGTVSGVTATHVGLGNVTNTSDANKPVSTAQQTALDAKLNINGAGVVSGSSQITLSSTTGYGSVINQNLLTTSNVQHASLGIGMAATGTAGRIDAANDIVAFSTSDIRFKENITPIENPIDKIRKISGNTYDWKAELKDVHGYEGNDVGVIAQEVEAVLPQLVQNRDNGYKAVKYDKLVALLIEGIKEQQLQIEQLRIDLNNCTNNKGL
jgi:hypothetical protein